MSLTVSGEAALEFQAHDVVQIITRGGREYSGVVSEDVRTGESWVELFSVSEDFGNPAEPSVMVRIECIEAVRCFGPHKPGQAA